MKTKSKGKKKQRNIFFILICITSLTFFLAVFFGFRGTLADTAGWAKGIWNDTINYIGGVEQTSGVPTTGWLASLGGLTPCVKGGFYGLTPIGSEGDNPRILRGAAWFGIGSQPDNIPPGSETNASIVCQTDSPSLGWLDFDQGSPSFCPSLPVSKCPDASEANDCHPAEWHKTGGGLPGDYTGCIDGWAQITSMMPPKSCNNGICPENGWVRIYNAKVDSTGTVTNENNYAWNSGEETTIPGNSGLGWIKLDGLKINNCSGHPGCKTVMECQGWKVAASTPVSDICTTPDSTGFRIIDDTHWKCRNECEETVETCSAVINPPQDGVCGTANGTTICDSSKPIEWCKPGYGKPNHIPDLNSYQVTWNCEDPNGCGGASAACSASGLKTCGWVETNP